MSEVAKLYLTLCNPMDYSLPGSSIHGIFQARVLEWVAIPSSRGSSQPRNQTQVSRIVGRHFTVWATGEHSLKSLTKIPKNVLWEHILIFSELSVLSSEDPITSKPLFLSSLSFVWLMFFFIVLCTSHSVMSNSLRPHVLYPSSIYGRLQAKILEWVAIHFSKGSSQPRIEARSLALQADLLPSEPFISY